MQHRRKADSEHVLIQQQSFFPCKEYYSIRGLKRAAHQAVLLGGSLQTPPTFLSSYVLLRSLARVHAHSRSLSHFLFLELEVSFPTDTPPHARNFENVT